MENKTNLKNHFLVAMPTLADPNFKQSVVYIHEHSDTGAIGMVVNKPMRINLGSVFEHLKIKSELDEVNDIEVLMGGPVNQENGFILYQPKAKQIEVSASKEMLQNIALGKGPQDFIVTLGYSGWGNGQLEEEIMRNDWIIVPADPDILFATPMNNRWRKSAELIGVDIDKISSLTGHG